MREQDDLVTKKRFRQLYILAGFLFGVGIIAFIDEVVFHQILAWHHFYDRSTLYIGLLSDGLFHVFSWFATVGGLFLFADLVRRHRVMFRPWIGGILLGMGAFQLYDGIVHHKILRVHQIRYVDNLFIYDLVWNGAAIVLLIIGMIVLRKSTKNEE